VCAGGRFDGLVEQLGGKPVCAAGFAMGLERLLELAQKNLEPSNRPHVYLVLVGDTAQRAGMQLAEQLRDALPELNLLTNCGGGSFKSQFKKADRSEAQLALILGEDEVAQQTISIKFLREEKGQATIDQSALAGWLRDNLFTLNR